MEKQTRTNKDGSKTTQYGEKIVNYDKVEGLHIGDTYKEKKDK